MPRKKKTDETEEIFEQNDQLEESVSSADEAAEKPTTVQKRRPVRVKKEPDILTVDAGDLVETQEERDNAAWFEMRNAFRTHTILTGRLDAIEEYHDSGCLAIVYYKEFRVVIPISEMMIELSENEDYGDILERQSKIVGRMLGCEIDFIIKGMDNQSRSIVASRKDAMLKKRQLFYMQKNSDGSYKLNEGRIVQARVVSIAEKVLRVEIFGVECPIYAKDISGDWLGDARDYYTIGDRILVRVNEISRKDVNSIRVRADIRSLRESENRAKLENCKLQAKYAGVITDINNGLLFIRLSNGVNAIARTCRDNRAPGKRDEVSFVMTKIDLERNVAMGIVTRIIRQSAI